MRYVCKAFEWLQNDFGPRRFFAPVFIVTGIDHTVARDPFHELERTGSHHGLIGIEIRDFIAPVPHHHR